MTIAFLLVDIEHSTKRTVYGSLKKTAWGAVWEVASGEAAGASTLVPQVRGTWVLPQSLNSATDMPGNLSFIER